MSGLLARLAILWATILQRSHGEGRCTAWPTSDTRKGSLGDSYKPVCLLQRSAYTASRAELANESEDAQIVTVRLASELQESAEHASSLNSTTQPLRVELHLRLGLLELQQHGPLEDLASSLQLEMCSSVSFPDERLSFLDIRGDSAKVNLMMLNGTKLNAVLQATRGQRHYPEIAAMDPMADSQEVPAALGYEAGTQGKAIVDFEVLPGELASDPSPHMFLELVQEQLRDEDGVLMTGKLADILRGAVIVEGVLPKN